jgi:pyroglutamyl-peptidase
MTAAVSLLATGFGPFPGMPVNRTGWLMQRLGAMGRLPDVRARLSTAILPTSWRYAPLHLRRAVTASKPDAILLFGVSSRDTVISIETMARNQCDCLCDCRGGLPRGDAIRSAAPAVIPAMALARPLLSALSTGGIPVRLSDDAGHYLCNAMFFESLHGEWHKRRPALVSFIHIPASIEMLPADSLAKAARLMLRTAALQAAALRRRGRRS